MTIKTNMQLVGAKEAINNLNKIEPQLKKDFKMNVQEIAAPAVQAGAAAYKDVPLSNMGYKWAQKGRSLFPYSVPKARSGVKADIDTRKRATAFILIKQMNPAAAIFETAGRANMNPLGQSLDRVANERGFKPAEKGRTRIIGRVVYAVRPKIQDQMEKIVINVLNDVQRQLW